VKVKKIHEQMRKHQPSSRPPSNILCVLNVLLARILSAQDAMISRTLLEATWEQARKRMARREWKTKKEKDSCWNRVEQ